MLILTCIFLDKDQHFLDNRWGDLCAAGRVRCSVVADSKGYSRVSQTFSIASSQPSGARFQRATLAKGADHLRQGIRVVHDNRGDPLKPQKTASVQAARAVQYTFQSAGL
jgi:hypothetical protein